MKQLKIIKWILFTIAYIYSLINVIIFIVALIYNCINWNSESVVSEILKLALCLITVILWHIDLNISTYYEKSLENDNKEIDNKYNHIVRLQNRIDEYNNFVRLQNRIDEYNNFEWLVVNKEISMLYVGLSETNEIYNNYVQHQYQKLTTEEFQLVKDIYYKFIEVEG